MQSLSLSLYIYICYRRMPRRIIKMTTRRSKLEAMNGGHSRPGGRCKRHPKHQQSPGVCSLCLTEKLSQLSNESSRAKGHCSSSSSSSSSSSLSSCYSSISGSSLSSPVCRYRNAAAGKGPLSLLFSGKNVLTKSRSMAFVSRTRGDKEGGVEKKKVGLLSKLLRPNKEKILVLQQEG